MDSSSSFQMSTSLIENIKKSSSSDVMSQSLDPHVLSNNLRNHAQQNQHNPLVAASKMMPVPESLMSPDCGPAAMHMLHTAAPTTAVNKAGNVLKKGIGIWIFIAIDSSLPSFFTSRATLDGQNHVTKVRSTTTRSTQIGVYDNRLYAPKCDQS